MCKTYFCTACYLLRDGIKDKIARVLFCRSGLAREMVKTVHDTVRQHPNSGHEQAGSYGYGLVLQDSRVITGSVSTRWLS